MQREAFNRVYIKSRLRPVGHKATMIYSFQQIHIAMLH